MDGEKGAESLAVYAFGFRKLKPSDYCRRERVERQERERRADVPGYSADADFLASGGEIPYEMPERPSGAHADSEVQSCQKQEKGFVFDARKKQEIESEPRRNEQREQEKIPTERVSVFFQDESSARDRQRDRDQIGEGMVTHVRKIMALYSRSIRRKLANGNFIASGGRLFRFFGNFEEVPHALGEIFAIRERGRSVRDEIGFVFFSNARHFRAVFRFVFNSEDDTVPNGFGHAVRHSSTVHFRQTGNVGYPVRKDVRKPREHRKHVLKVPIRGEKSYGRKKKHPLGIISQYGGNPFPDGWKSDLAVMVGEVEIEYAVERIDVPFLETDDPPFGIFRKNDERVL